MTLNIWVCLPAYFAGLVPAYRLLLWLRTHPTFGRPRTKGERRVDLICAPFWPFELGVGLLSITLLFIPVGLVCLIEWGWRRIGATNWRVVRWLNDGEME